MFGWLKAKATASFYKGDTEKVLFQVHHFPQAIQRSCAERVASDILGAQRDMDAAAGARRESAFQQHFANAGRNRQAAIRRGAKDYSDPDWAAAALVEAWLLAKSGHLGRPAFEHIDGLISGWMMATLSRAEIRQIEDRIARAL